MRSKARSPGCAGHTFHPEIPKKKQFVVRCVKKSVDRELQTCSEAPRSNTKPWISRRYRSYSEPVSCSVSHGTIPHAAIDANFGPFDVFAYQIAGFSAVPFPPDFNSRFSAVRRRESAGIRPPNQHATDLLHVEIPKHPISILWIRHRLSYFRNALIDWPLCHQIAAMTHPDRATAKSRIRLILTTTARMLQQEPRFCCTWRPWDVVLSGRAERSSFLCPLVFLLALFRHQKEELPQETRKEWECSPEFKGNGPQIRTRSCPFHPSVSAIPPM
jgi:hypothetical protein